MENKLTTHRLKNMATHSNRILGPQLARAWVTTVINPIFERVQKEQHWLHKKNWFWIYTTGWFEYFAPISGYIDLRYYANYELFCEQYQAIAGLFDEHDKSLDNLATALGSLYKKISILPKFQTEFQKLESESRIKDINYEDAWGALGEHDRPKLLIQYTVNNIQRLPSFYTMSELWNTFGKRFLSLRNDSAVQPIVSEVNQHGRDLLKVSIKIEKKIKDLRSEYAREFDIPPIPLEEF